MSVAFECVSAWAMMGWMLAFSDWLLDVWISCDIAMALWRHLALRKARDASNVRRVCFLDTGEYGCCS